MIMSTVFISREPCTFLITTEKKNDISVLFIRNRTPIRLFVIVEVQTSNEKVQSKLVYTADRTL